MAFCSQHGKLIFIQTFNIKHLFLKLLMLLLDFERLYIYQESGRENEIKASLLYKIWGTEEVFSNPCLHVRKSSCCFSEVNSVCEM